MGTTLAMEIVVMGIAAMEAVGTGIVIVMATAGMETILSIAEGRWMFENLSSRMRTACGTTEDPTPGSEGRGLLPCRGVTRAGLPKSEAATATRIQVGKTFSFY